MTKKIPSQSTNGRPPGNGHSETPVVNAFNSGLTHDNFGSGRMPPPTEAPTANIDNEGQADLSATPERDQEIIAMVHAMTLESRQAAPRLPLVRGEIEKRISDHAAEKTDDLNKVATSLAVHARRYISYNKEEDNAWNH